mmetsp:Transcript_103213/g.315821  ORF Transcript_103213/g.315821 Transcript_103213/m.315821 type:complete len:214 (-) Transcript_103213:1025-1666(-)
MRASASSFWSAWAWAALAASWSKIACGAGSMTFTEAGFCASSKPFGPHVNTSYDRTKPATSERWTFRHTNCPSTSAGNNSSKKVHVLPKALKAAATPGIPARMLGRTYLFSPVPEKLPRTIGHSCVLVKPLGLRLMARQITAASRVKSRRTSPARSLDLHKSQPPQPSNGLSSPKKRQIMARRHFCASAPAYVRSASMDCSRNLRWSAERSLV